eukprot:g33264.t1
MHGRANITKHPAQQVPPAPAEAQESQQQQGDTSEEKDEVGPFPESKEGGSKSSISPYQLVYGCEPDIPTSLLHPKDTWADADELFGMRLRVKMEAEQIVRAHRDAERRKTDAEGVRQAQLDQIKFQVGDIVLLYHPQIPKGAVTAPHPVF